MAHKSAAAQWNALTMCFWEGFCFCKVGIVLEYDRNQGTAARLGNKCSISQKHKTQTFPHLGALNISLFKVLAPQHLLFKVLSGREALS